ncbi:MAG: hypothetical protein ABTQ25_07130 [Nitrosomonas ureae]
MNHREHQRKQVVGVCIPSAEALVPKRQVWDLATEAARPSSRLGQGGDAG